MQTYKIVGLLLRIGVAFAFIYPAFSALINPSAWIGFFPLFVINLFPFDTIILLHLFGAVEVSIALWILSGKNIFWPSILAGVMLLLIIIFNFSQMDVIFRDIPILLMIIILALLSRQHFPRQDAPEAQPN